VSKLSEEKIDKSAPSTMGGGFGISSGPTKPSSAAKRPLAGVTTNFYVGTEVSVTMPWWHLEPSCSISKVLYWYCFNWICQCQIFGILYMWPTYGRRVFIK